MKEELILGLTNFEFWTLMIAGFGAIGTAVQIYHSIFKKAKLKSIILFPRVKTIINKGKVYVRYMELELSIQNIGNDSITLTEIYITHSAHTEKPFIFEIFHPNLFPYDGSLFNPIKDNDKVKKLPYYLKPNRVWSVSLKIPLSNEDNNKSIEELKNCLFLIDLKTNSNIELKRKLTLEKFNFISVEPKPFSELKVSNY